MCSLPTSKQKDGMIGDKIACFIMEGSTNEDGTRPRHREPLIAFRGNTEADTRREHPILKSVLDRDERPATPSPFTSERYILEQRENEFCLERSESMGDSQSYFDYDQYRKRVQKAKLDGLLQKVVPERPRQCLLHLAHYPVMAGHPGGTPTYYTLRREYC